MTISAASAVATGAAALFAYWAYDAAMEAVGESRKQVDAALEANKISHRTFEEGISSSVHFTAAEFRFGTDADEAPRISIQVPIGNDGGTTTRGLAFRAVCATTTEAPAEPFDRERLGRARS